MQNKNRERKTYLARQRLEAKWRKTTDCCSRRTPLLAVHGGARLAGCCHCLFQARLQTKREMVACWLVDISPLFLVLLEGKDGFCWFCYCGWGKVWLLLVPSCFECYQAGLSWGRKRDEWRAVSGGLCGLCWQRGKACKWCLRWLQAGGVRSGEGAATDRERWGGGGRML